MNYQLSVVIMLSNSWIYFFHYFLPLKKKTFKKKKTFTKNEPKQSLCTLQTWEQLLEGTKICHLLEKRGVTDLRVWIW